MSKVFTWSADKNRWLMERRGVSFEAVVSRIAEGGVLSVVPGGGKYKHQKQFIVEMYKYIYVVPFVEDDSKFFLKTVIPSRKLTKRFLSGGFV